MARKTKIQELTEEILRTLKTIESLDNDSSTDIEDIARILETGRVYRDKLKALEAKRWGLIYMS